jgi:lipoprotein-anchoring transpeptidase ErfK/SrfK
MIRGICLVLAASTLGALQAAADPAAPRVQVVWNGTASPATANVPVTPSANALAQSASPGNVAAVGVAPSEQIEPDIEQRLRDNLSAEMLQNFGLFIYVSKAEVGPWAQHMVVFQKAGDQLLPLYNWPVSTGRETVEANATGAQMATTTPAGYYELDPKRFYVDYHSTQWNEPMPYAMFFNWKEHGVQTGLAIHATTDDDVGLLGKRASAGCVRISLENAHTLFDLVQGNYKGSVPKFGYDKYAGTIMNNGLLMHDGKGELEMTTGYRALVYIDEYGGENLEAKAY